MKKYKVTLTAEERNSLQGLVAAKKTAAKKVIHARILLKADAGPDGPAFPETIQPCQCPELAVLRLWLQMA